MALSGVIGTSRRSTGLIDPDKADQNVSVAVRSVSAARDSATTLTRVVGSSRRSTGPIDTDKVDQIPALLSSGSLASHPTVVGSGSGVLDRSATVSKMTQSDRGSFGLM